MTKRRGRSQKTEREEAPETASPAFQWIPLWGWALIFLVPLLVSELMFWNVGKTTSMVLFPIAWAGFFYVMMQRSGWPILKNRKSKEESATEEDG